MVAPSCQTKLLRSADTPANAAGGWLQGGAGTGPADG